MALLTLVRANILMEVGGDVANCYRAHPLLRELLRAQLAYLTPELVPELHLRAARWFARSGLALQAVAHYGTASCWQEAAEMVVDAGLIAEALRPSSPPLVQRFADMPQDTPGAPAGVVRAAVALARADVPACDMALDQVEQSSGGATQPHLDVAVAATRLASAATRADSEETLVRVARAEEALSALAHESAGAGADRGAGPGLPDHADLRSLVLSAKGLAQLATGELTAAAGTLTEAVGACVEAGFGPEQLANLARLALAEALQGHLNRARELVDTAVALAGEQSGTAAGPLPAVLVVADAWTLAETDDADAARQAALAPLAPMEPDEQVPVDTLLSVLGSRVGRARKSDEATALPGAEVALPCWLRDLVSQEQAAVELLAKQPQAALTVAEMLPDPRSHRAVVLLARASLALGDPTAATLLDPAGIERADSVPVDVQVDAWLVKAQARAVAGDHEQAVTALRRGMRLARPESMRRPFRDAANDVRRMLRAEASLASAATWLSRSPGPLALTKLVSITQDTDGTPVPIVVDALSGRETEVLRHLADLLTTEEVAATCSCRSTPSGPTSAASCASCRCRAATRPSDGPASCSSSERGRRHPPPEQARGS